MPPDLIGGRYRLSRVIGQGGMGSVYLGRDEVLHREVAVKRVGLLPGESVTDSARAMREARSSAALSHRNVVTVFDVVEDAGEVWLVMEHVPSRSLAEIIKQDGPLEPAVVASIGADVADGLAAAHAAGVIHRDVKPGNVLVREDGTAMISDFGIARVAGDPAITQSGLLTGTPSYFSPELARGESPGPPADVWALGATLYAAVEGRPPYQGQTNPIAILDDIARNQPPAPRRAGFLEPVLLAMMARDPGARWTMDDARQALQRLRSRAEDDGAPTRVIAAPTPTPKAATQPAPAADPGPGTAGGPRRLRGLYAALLVAVLVVAGLGFALLNRDPGGDVREASDTPTATSTPSPRDTAASGTPSDAPSPSASPTLSSSPSDNSSSATPSRSSTPDSSRMSAFLRDYFSAAPGGTDEAWARLGPREKAQGRASYDRFWEGIRSVQVADVQPVADTDFVDATVTYRTTDGAVSVERKRFTMLRSENGEYLIDAEQPIG
jgi:serine/threonine protein kinase